MVSCINTVFIVDLLCTIAHYYLPYINLGPTTVNSIGDLSKFTTTVTNNGDETLRILRDPNSAMSEFPGEKFTIADPSESQLSFKGARVKYVPAIAALNNEFTTLEPQQSITIEHDCQYTIFLILLVMLREVTDLATHF